MRRLVLTLLLSVGGLLVLASAGLYAQTDEPEPREYIGADECGSCHRPQGRPFDLTAHARALLTTEDAEEGEPGPLLADFSIQEEVRTFLFPGEDAPRALQAADITYIMGTGRLAQRFAYRQGEAVYVLPVQWNVPAGTWEPFLRGAATDATWFEAPEHDWLTQCVGCHVTGLDVGTGEWVDSGVQCEACHGPGSEHATLADELGRRASAEEVQTVKDAIHSGVDPQMCAQCHAAGTSTDGVHAFPVGYHPGQDLSDFYTLHDL
ncbi:MAG: hypothetical protein HC915_18230, partial [Anaerolineae bacterium]|nr:hypothetical protein [Anaerolineae bacterium]